MRLILFSLLLAGVLMGGEEKADQRVFGKSKEESYRDKVVVLKVGQEDLVNKQAFRFFRRTLRRVDEEGAKAVVFDLDTPGGYAKFTAELMMKEMASLKAKSFAFVNPEATSAGALIAVGTDEIYVKPVSAIGSAALVAGNGMEIPDTMRAKLDSAYGSFVRSVVKSKGHNLEVVEAMMFPEKRFNFYGVKTRDGEERDIRIGKGELLNLTGEEAAAEYEGGPLLAKDIVESLEELLEKEGLGDAEVVEARMTAFEQFAYWMQFAGPVLILIGFAGGYFEMKTPGFGIGGAIALAAFGLFFFGNSVAGNLAGYELAAIFLLGMILVALDIFLFPGTFVMGFLGVALMLGSLLFAMVDRFEIEDVQEGAFSINWWDILSWPMTALAMGVLGSIAAMAVMMKYLPEVSFFRKLSLPAVVGGGAAEMASGEGEKESRVGWTGEAVTDLHPAGKAEFQGEVIDVTADSAFVEQGSRVRVVSDDAFRVVVKAIDAV